MANMIKTQAYENVKNILLAPKLAYAIPVQVANTNVTADANGRKIIKAGTPIGGATSALLTPNTVLSVVSNNTAQGLLLWDLDVTDGNNNGTMLVRGVVDSSKIKDFDTVVPTAVRGVLPNITFRNGEYD